jgi:hypothetical protein
VPPGVVSELEADGRIVARKTVTTTEDRTRLAHEAAVLDLAQHPGVVEVIGHEDDGTTAALVTAFVGSHSLDTVGALPLERAAGIVAAVAETVADLHQQGLVHGRIEPSHVLIGTGGRPVLCGFAGGGRIGTIPPPGPAAPPGFLDPAASDDAALTPQRDVYALGALLRTLIGESSADLEPIPDRRFGLGALRTPWSGYQRRALQTLIDRATDDAPLRRPSARRFAADLRDTIPNAHLRGDDGDPYDVLRMSVPEVDDRPNRHRAGLVAMFAGLALVAVGINGWRDAGGAPTGARRATTITPQASPTSTSAPSTTTSAPPVDPNCATAALVADDFDGDGCGDEVHVGPDGVVTVGTRRFAVGNDTDRVAIGDWDCNGIATPAVLRPATGSLFVFDRWATDAPSTIEPRTSLPGASDIYARVGAKGCSTLVAVFGDGSEEEVSL